MNVPRIQRIIFLYIDTWYKVIANHSWKNDEHTFFPIIEVNINKPRCENDLFPSPILDNPVLVWSFVSRLTQFSSLFPCCWQLHYYRIPLSPSDKLLSSSCLHATYQVATKTKQTSLRVRYNYDSIYVPIASSHRKWHWTLYC